MKTITKKRSQKMSFKEACGNAKGCKKSSSTSGKAKSDDKKEAGKKPSGKKGGFMTAAKNARKKCK